MKKVRVNPKKCPHNHSCSTIKACPAGAISQQDAKSLPVVDSKRCIGCGKCVRLCRKGAFEFENEDCGK